MDDERVALQALFQWALPAHHGWIGELDLTGGRGCRQAAELVSLARTRITETFW